MPWVLVSLVTWLADFFGKKFVTVVFRLAVIAALVVLLLAAVNGFLAIINTSLTSVSATVPDVIAKVWSWMMPSNAKTCIVVIISARIAKFFFTLSYRMLKTKAKLILSGS